MTGRGGGSEPGAPGEREVGSGPDPAAVREALREVVDPEVGLDVVTMGLIYGISVDGATVRVRHTLTTSGCPMADLLERALAHAVRGVPGVEDVETALVWDPPWHPGMIAEGAWDGES